MQKMIFQGHAPGRLDVMGGISDYSGGLVLQQPISESTTVSFEPGVDGQCHLFSEVDGVFLEARIPCDALLHGGQPAYSKAAGFFKENSELSWAAYVLGVALVLMQEKRILFLGGTFRINSSVPSGKGVSSSAALELATLRALCSAFGVLCPGTEAAILAQRAENLIAGVACGLMDQLASGHGKSGHLLPILCQPDVLLTTVPVPAGIQFAGLDSGIRHAVGGASYSDVRCAAFMGYTIMALEMGASVSDLRQFLVDGDRNRIPWQGYLCNVPPDAFANRWERFLPQTMTGREFFQIVPFTIDTVTQPDPDRSYSIRTCTRHPVLERGRVQRFLETISSASPDPVAMGRLMLESHEGYSACGLGSERTNEIVEMAMKDYPNILTGARISGGGSGGTVCLLAAGNESAEALKDLRTRMEQRYGCSLKLFLP